MTWKGPNDTCTHSGLHYRRGTVGLGNLILNSKQACCHYPRKRYYLCVFHGCKQICPLLLMMLPPFSKAVHYKNNFKKIIRNKGSQDLYSQNVYKCERPMEICPATAEASTVQWNTEPPCSILSPYLAVDSHSHLFLDLTKSSRPFLQHFFQIYVTPFPSFTYIYYPTLDLMTHYFKHLWKQRTRFLFLIFISNLPSNISLGICPYRFSLLHYPGDQVIHLNASLLFPPATGEDSILTVHYYNLVSHIPPVIVLSLPSSWHPRFFKRVKYSHDLHFLIPTLFIYQLQLASPLTITLRHLLNQFFSTESKGHILCLILADLSYAI